MYKLHICLSDIQPGTSSNSCSILALIDSSKILNNGYSSPFEIGLSSYLLKIISWNYLKQ